MSSSQPVTTPNALNFTPDNKRAYAYSGVKGINNSVAELIGFSTNSETFDARIQFFVNNISNDDVEYIIKFNDVQVLAFLQPQTYQSSSGGYVPIHMIIPPFTDVSITLQNKTDSSTLDHSCSITGNVYGMVDVGYQ